MDTLIEHLVLESVGNPSLAQTDNSNCGQCMCHLFCCSHQEVKRSAAGCEDSIQVPVNLTNAPEDDGFSHYTHTFTLSVKWLYKFMPSHCENRNSKQANTV